LNPAPAANEAEDLEALFDSIAAERQAAMATATPRPAKLARARTRTARTAPVAAAPATATPAASAPAVAAPAAPDAADPAQAMLQRIGQMTRSLHDNLRGLGYHQLIEDAVAAMPDARERLAYVATMTERAAQRVLDAAEAARPPQQALQSEAETLAARWQEVFSGALAADAFPALAHATRDYPVSVPERTRATGGHLTEIVLAQDFQDLTGQVIKRVSALVHGMEQELVKILVEHAPPQKRPAAASGLLNGPVVGADGRADVVTSQTQVDSLLESLGF